MSNSYCVKILAGFTVFATVVSLTACSSSSGGKGTGKTKLTVALPVIDPSYAQVYIAAEEGYFQDENLDVDITQVGGNVLTNIVSGHADLAMYGTANALYPIANGEQTSVIYGNTTGRNSGFVAAATKVKSLAGCRTMGSQQAGSASYALAVQLKSAAKATYKILALQDYGTIVASLGSGNVDCAIGPLAQYQALVAAGKAHFVVDQRVPSTVPLGGSGSDIITGAVFGLKSNIASKRDAIVRFLKAYQKALDFIHTKSPAEIAAILHKTKDFATQAIDSLTGQLDVDRQLDIFAGVDDGAFPTSTWDKTLDFFKNGGVTGVDFGSSKYSYDACVDMSYFESATGKKVA